jgi:hypothetical protein
MVGAAASVQRRRQHRSARAGSRTVLLRHPGWRGGMSAVCTSVPRGPRRAGGPPCPSASAATSNAGGRRGAARAQIGGNFDLEQHRAGRAVLISMWQPRRIEDLAGETGGSVRRLPPKRWRMLDPSSSRSASTPQSNYSPSRRCDEDSQGWRDYAEMTMDGHRRCGTSTRSLLHFFSFKPLNCVKLVRISIFWLIRGLGERLSREVGNRIAHGSSIKICRLWGSPTNGG